MRKPTVSDRVLMVLALVAAETILSIVGASPSWAYAKPDTTTSVYETTTDLGTIESQAVTQAGNGRSGTVILDFGRPAYSSSAGTGYVDFSDTFVTRAQVLSAVEHYARYWWLYSPAGAAIRIAIGTSNSSLYTDPGCPCGYEATNLNQYGVEIGDDVAAFQANNYLNSYQGTSAAGALDAEPAWDQYSQGTEGGSTRQILAGFNSQTNLPLYDYGSAESGYWGNNTEADIAWGVNVAAGKRVDYPDDYPFPEIYLSGQPPEWETIDCYDHSNGVGMIITGVMTEQPESGTYSYQGAYDAMIGALGSGCGGITTQNSIAYSSNNTPL